MVIYNAKIYTMNDDDKIIENGYIEIQNGKITKVGEGRPKKDDSNMYDMKGANAFPGFIDAHTHMGLTTAGVGIEGEDLNEGYDPCTPQLRIIDGINPMDYSFELARKSGITTVFVSPGSTNPIAGQIYAVKTLGKRIDKMVIKPIGMKFAMGENPKLTYADNETSPCTRMAVASTIREELFKAQRYMQDTECEDDMPEYDIKSQSLIPLLKREIKAHFHCHRADDIFTAIRLAKEFDLDYTLVHCTDGYLIADELKDENVSCIVGPVICDRCKPEMANLSPKNAGILANSGIKTAVCTDHSEVPIEYLPISVGICIKNGMSFYDGLKSVTKVPAKIGGIFDRTGSLEVGKDADIVVFKGSPFEIMSAPEMVITNGKIVEVD